MRVSYRRLERLFDSVSSKKCNIRLGSHCLEPQAQELCLYLLRCQLLAT